MMMQFRNLSFSIDRHVARVELQRPPVNALNSAFVNELTSLARTIRLDPDVWVVTVRSTLPVFCAGADLKERAFSTAVGVKAAVKKIQLMVRAWLDIPQPVLVRLEGPAMGGGLEFALAGDLIVAADDIMVGFPEVGLGIIPAAGGTQLLSRKTSPGIAKKWILTGNKFTAAEAQRDGVIDLVCPRSRLGPEFELLLSTISSQPPLALRQAKKAINAGIGLTLSKGFAIEQTCYQALIKTNDRREALQAFIEKRKPSFKGT
jgi:methylglutaconyl-CoA hydratase